MPRMMVSVMSEQLNRILQARAGGAVQRCHTVRHFGSYSVAEHSWGVAMLVLQLYPEHFTALAAYALVHDVPEGLTGDIPSTAKADDGMLDDAINRRFGLPSTSELNPIRHAILKSCDRLELYLWAYEQAAMGNRFADEIQTNLLDMFNRSQPESGLDIRAHSFFHNHIKNKSCVPDRVGLLNKIKEQYDIK